MRIWKENLRKILQNPIRRSVSTLIWGLIPIQLRRLPPSTPFLVSNPASGGRQHPRPGTYSDRRRLHHRIPVTPLCHIQHICRYRHCWKRTRTRNRMSPGGQVDNPGQRRQTQARYIQRNCHGLFPPKCEWYCRIRIIKHHQCHQLRGEEGSCSSCCPSCSCGTPFFSPPPSPPTAPPPPHPLEPLPPHCLVNEEDKE